MNAPGAMMCAPLAALVTPPRLTIGVVVFFATAAGTNPIPDKPEAETAWIDIVVLLADFDGTQVAAHCPPPNASSGTWLSPSENEATTDPVFTPLPQLSKIVTAIGVGAPTVAWKPRGGREVKSPLSTLGVQVSAAAACACSPFRLAGVVPEVGKLRPCGGTPQEGIGVAELGPTGTRLAQ